MNYPLPYIIPHVLCLVTGYVLAVVALIRGRHKQENIFLAILCVWSTLLSWAFISQNFLSDTGALLKVERVVHSFYVYYPFLSIVFFQIITGRKSFYISAAGFTISTIILFFVQTDLYFYGFRYYTWGMIARGGPAFDAFCYYSSVVIFYVFYLFIRKLMTEKNRVVRLKINYLLISFLITALMTLTNIPAINGIDFYPLSNFIFIPLGIMTYGILRHRLIDISSALHYTIFWLVLSSIIIIPNLFFIANAEKCLVGINIFYRVLIFIAFFAANYFYFDRIQPLINSLINRNNYKIRKTEKMLMANVSLLKNIEVLRSEVASILNKTLGLSHATIYLGDRHPGIFRNSHGDAIELDTAEIMMLVSYEKVYLQKSLIETGDPDPILHRMISLMVARESEYLVPLVNQNDLVALVFLSEKQDSKQFNGNEFRFIKNFSAYLTIAFANSAMYHNLSEVRDNLEMIVDERTSVIEKQKSELEEDIQFARKIQMSLLPRDIPAIKNFRIAYRYEPILGVGGDFLDIHSRDGMNDLGLFICDVSGHGASSAMIASMVKMSLNSWGKFIQKPAEAFVMMKSLLSGKIGDNFITAFMCSVDLEKGIVTSACAGHPPMIILRKGGDVELVKPGGMIIIDSFDSEYQEARTRLNPGDMIVLYTDGVVEARLDSGGMIGNEGFIAMLKKYAGLQAGDLCGRIYDEIFSNNSLKVIEDDFALLVAEYT